MERFETQWLTAEENLLALADLSGQWIDIPASGSISSMVVARRKASCLTWIRA